VSQSPVETPGDRPRRASASWPSRRSRACDSGSAAHGSGRGGRHVGQPVVVGVLAALVWRLVVASRPRRPHRRPTGRRTAVWQTGRDRPAPLGEPSRRWGLLSRFPIEPSEFLATRACSSSAALPVTRAARRLPLGALGHDRVDRSRAEAMAAHGLRNASRSRASTTASVRAVTVAVRGTSRRSAISPNTSPFASGGNAPREQVTSKWPSAMT
jgi:hypothetical protein